MCIKHCKNFKKIQEREKFQVATEANFRPYEKIKFNVNNTSDKNFTLYSKIKNDIFTKLYNYIKSTLSKISTIPKQTSNGSNLQTWNNSIQTEETAIKNNLIHVSYCNKKVETNLIFLVVEQ